VEESKMNPTQQQIALAQQYMAQGCPSWDQALAAAVAAAPAAPPPPPAPPAWTPPGAAAAPPAQPAWDQPPAGPIPSGAPAAGYQPPPPPSGGAADEYATFAPARPKLPVGRYPFEISYKGQETKPGKDGKPSYVRFKYHFTVCDGPRKGSVVFNDFRSDVYTDRIVECAKAAGVKVQMIQTPEGATPRLKPGDLNNKRIEAEVTHDGDFQRLGDYKPYQPMGAMTPPAAAGPVGGWGPPR
jgi:hypothetical protein